MITVITGKSLFPSIGCWLMTLACERQVKVHAPSESLEVERRVQHLNSWPTMVNVIAKMLEVLGLL